MNKYFVIAMLLLIFSLMSCERDPNSAVNNETNPVLKGAFIINEGGWTKNNGSLSFYDPAKHTVQNNIFSAVNDSSLGDVVQSMSLYDTLGFIVVSNYNKIEVISLNTWKRVATIHIPMGGYPRNIAFHDGKGYVTNLFGNSVSVIDLATFDITATILVGANPEEILITGNKAYVANSGFGSGKTVSVIDLNQQKVVKEITVGDNPGFLTLDADGEVNVLCVGRWPAWGDSTDTGTNGGVYVIDPAQDAVVDSLNLIGHPTELADGGNGTGFFIYNGNVASYSTETNKMVNDTLVTGFFYAVEADPSSQQLFVLDGKDFQQNGELRIYDFDGNLLETHTVGVIPGAVTFKYDQE